MHFILQAGKIAGHAVGIELIVKLKYHAQGILRVRKSLQVPGVRAGDLFSAIYDEPQGSHIADFCNRAAEVQNLSADWHSTGLRHGSWCRLRGNYICRT